MDTDLAEFFEDLTEPVREFTSEEQGIDGVTQPDSLTAALLAYPELREETATYHVDVDEREGLTRGYTYADVDDVTDEPARTTVVESADGDQFEAVSLAMLRDRDPDAPVET
jgi:purine nucleosidase